MGTNDKSTLESKDLVSKHHFVYKENCLDHLQKFDRHYTSAWQMVIYIHEILFYILYQQTTNFDRRKDSGMELCDDIDRNKQGT